MLSLAAQAGITTYQFTSKSWASKVGASSTDKQMDGWISDKDGYEYMTGRTDAEGRLYSQGVSVKKSTSGAGATSVREFTDVRRITFNFCLNSSSGRGAIYVQVGENEPDSIVIHKPATSGSGVYLRDSVVNYTTPESGKIRFWIRCSENAINLNSITIRSAEGGTNPFTVDSYQLVTSEAQLSDSDQIIIGVHQAGVNYIMGYFDEDISQNNIHAIRGKYTPDRLEVDENDYAIYTLRKGETSKGAAAWYIQDELRYEEAYLVASGGQSKNRLALWNHLYDDKTYGDYGYWDIEVAMDGKATIKNLGRSKGIYLQYNAVNNPTLFSCYESMSQTPVAIYRRVAAIGDVPGIAAKMLNMGDQLLPADGAAEGLANMMVNANRLTEDIAVSLRHGAPFSLDVNTLDRDGDRLAVRFSATEPGLYIDTLVFRSGEVTEEAPVMLNVVRPLRVAEAVREEDFTMVYLNDVVVTKKYDTYIFVRDLTAEVPASMLIYDAGDGTGHRYGAGLKNGDVLHGVIGRVRNYFGVPELIPTESWTQQSAVQCEPEEVTAIDSADGCRYVRIVSPVMNGTVTLEGVTLPLVDKFDTGIIDGAAVTTDVVVFISWDELELWVVTQTMATDVTSHSALSTSHSALYNVLGQRVDASYRGLVITEKGKKSLR